MRTSSTSTSTSTPPSSTSTFPIPSSLQDLEHEPYDLLPYPIGFSDDDEATRADSFHQLTLFLERGNRTLEHGGMDLFETAAIDHGGDYDDVEVWNSEDRIQALYTLVRKSASLSMATRNRVIGAICQAVCTMSSILSSASKKDQINRRNSKGSTASASSSNYVAPQAFRDALACQLYMLYTIMIFMESEIKADKSLTGKTSSSSNNNHNHANNKRKTNKAHEKERQAIQNRAQENRELCAAAMHQASLAMARHKSNLWKRGVPNENVISIPCRIAYQMLENATGAIARKLASADLALEMIAVTVDSTTSSEKGLSLNSDSGSGSSSGLTSSSSSNDGVLDTVVSALIDMLHSYEHMAPLAAELCCLVRERESGPNASSRSPRGDKKPHNKLAVSLLREIGRLDASAASVSDTSGKASGIRNVAPFLNELAEKKPRLVLEHIGLVLPHLRSEPYNLRSAIATTIGQILIQCKNVNQSDINSDSDSDNERDGVDEEGEEGDFIGSNNAEAKKLEKVKASLYDILLEHAYDVSSYTRVAVMKTWATLIQAQSLPVDKLIPVTELAIDRLQDKTVMVRRSAMQVLTLVLENNPFTDSLNPAPYQNKMIEVRKCILENMPSNLKEAMEEAIDALDDDNEIEKQEIEDGAIGATIAECDAMSTGDEDAANAELSKKTKIFEFLNSAINFINVFETSNAAFEGMLLSSNKSDVTEALRFFVRARHFQLPSAVTGIKQALSLMWSDEKSVKEEVMTAFIDVFICGTNGKEKLPSKQIVDNLIRLVGKANVSELASIEEAISILVQDEIIPSEVFLILWSIAAKAHGKPRAVAMMILSMGATADSRIVDSASRLRHLLQAGLGDYTEEHRDWASAKSAAYALQRVSRVKPDLSSAKFLVLEQIVERLSIVIQGDWCDDESENDTLAWFGAAEEAINAIFAICPAPDQVSKLIIIAMQGSTFGDANANSEHFCHSLRLSRFFFVISHISLKLLVYSEALSCAVRGANAARTVSKQEQADKAKAERSESDDDGEDDIEAELGLAQAAEAETENKVAEIAEKEIVGRGLIDLYTPIVLHIVANKGGNFSSEILKQSSVLALCKFMSISKSFCEKHLPILFLTLANAPKRDITLRANTVIALGDLAFRFPNEVEPYTSRIYACLRDNSTRVRLHTLMVLTHLILNDMVKVKGQVCEIALCLRDKEIRIRDMARLLFHELSKRSNNPIYNLLPEIVSRLSSMPTVKKDDFRAIMGFLLNFIKKERQTEMLVEKLCQRFPKSTSISQKANISFCLANVKSNEKCIKILCDNFNLYKDALFDEDVLKHFTSIVSKTKKFAKPELKQALEEWEDKLKTQSEMGLENEEADKKAEKAKTQAAKRRTRARQQMDEDPEEESSESEEDSESASDSDDSDDSDDEPQYDEKENAFDVSQRKGKGDTKTGRSGRSDRRAVLTTVN